MQPTSILSQSYSIFFPQQKEADIDFKAAVAAVDQQQIARITKLACYTIASIATTAVVILMESTIVAWPVTIPIVVITLVAWGVFARLNWIDSRFEEGLDANKRAELAKQELERLFCSPCTDPPKESLKAINRLLGCPVFSPEYIEQASKGTTLTISNKLEWTEQGRFNLPSYNKTLDFQWSGKSDDPISLKYRSDLKDAPPEPEEIKAAPPFLED